MAFRLVPISANAILSGILSGQYTLSGAMVSPNYVHGVSGWAIGGDGSAEFNNLQIRGTGIIGPTSGQRIVIDSIAGTISMYNSSGTLTGQWSASAQALTVAAPTGGSSVVLSTVGPPAQNASAALLLKPPNPVINSTNAIAAGYIAAAMIEDIYSEPILAIASPSVSNDAGSFAATIQLYASKTGHPGQAQIASDSVTVFTTNATWVFTAAGGLVNTVSTNGNGVRVGSSASATACFACSRAAAADNAFSARMDGDTNSRWLVEASGRNWFGPGGAVASDTTVERTAAGELTVSGSLKTKAAPGAAVETWHAMTLQNLWTNNGVADSPASYRLVPSPANCVQIVGSIKGGTTAAGSIVIATLPAAYWPISNQHFALMPIGAAPGAGTQGFLDTTGNVRISATVGFTRVDFNAILPLDV